MAKSKYKFDTVYQIGRIVLVLGSLYFFIKALSVAGLENGSEIKKRAIEFGPDLLTGAYFGVILALTSFYELYTNGRHRILSFSLVALLGSALSYGLFYILPLSYPLYVRFTLNPRDRLMIFFASLGIALICEILKYFSSKSYRGLFAWKESWLPLVVFVSALCLFQVGNNFDYFSPLTILLFVCVFLVISFLLYLVITLFLANPFSKYAHILVSCFFIFGLFLLPNFRAFTEDSYINNEPFIWFIVGVAIVCSLYSSKDFLKLAVVMMASFSLIPLKNVVWYYIDPPKLIETEVKKELLGGKLKDPNLPNIYLFGYDGMPNDLVFDSFKVSKNRLNQLLNSNGFKIYPNTYSLGAGTLKSIASMLDMTSTITSDTVAKRIIAGHSALNRILRSGEYKNIIISYFGNYALKNPTIDEYYGDLPGHLVPLDSMVQVLRGLLQGEFKFDTIGLGSFKRFFSDESIDTDSLQDIKNEVIKRPKTKTFVFNHVFLPGHTTPGACWAPSDQSFQARLDRAIDQMRLDIETIKKYDPNAIIVVFGDHGPNLLADCAFFSIQNPKEITPLYVWDRIGTRLAVYWPDKNKAAKYDQNITVNQDVFSVILSYLTDSPAYLKEYEIKDKTFYGLRIKFLNGRLVP